MKFCTLCSEPMIPLYGPNRTPIMHCGHCDTTLCRKPLHKCGQCQSMQDYEYDYEDDDYFDVPSDDVSTDGNDDDDEGDYGWFIIVQPT